MNYRVDYAPSFVADLHEQLAFLRQELVSKQTIDRWFVDLFLKLDTLEQHPSRFPVDQPYSEQAEQETRKLFFGEHLAFYQIDEDAAIVNVVALIHGARRDKR